MRKSSKKIQVFEFADSHGIDRANVDPSSLDRLINDPHVNNTIGVSFPDGKLELKKPTQAVIRNLSKTLAKMSKSEFRVGDIYTKDSRAKWIDDIIKTQGAKKNPTEKLGADGGQKGKKALPKSTNRKRLIPDGLALVIKQAKINNIFRELRDDLVLDGRKATPNAVAVLFRVFLESSLHHYLDRNGIPSAKTTTITQMIAKVTQHMKENGIANENQLKAIRITSSKTSDILHVDRLHEYVHDERIMPDSDGLKSRWDNLQEFFEILWNALGKKNG